MNRRAMSYKPPVPQPARPKSRAPVREPKAKPEWVSDWTDTTDKYKISQAELIKKKAQRQSSNRQIAKQELAQRMRKLEQGIIDSDTRKVYESALLSKGIDINPPIRKNLSQMIAYQKEMQMLSRQHQQQQSVQSQDEVQKQIKDTQQFIKRMEKANKARDINHAIQILEPTKNSQTFIKSKTHTILTAKQDLTPLQNIQGTMNFLQNLLKNRGEEQNQNLTLQLPKNIHQQLQSFSKQIVGGIYHTQRLQQDLNLMSFVQKKDQYPTPNRLSTHTLNTLQDDEWSNTIKRMQNMMESKQKQLNKHFQYTVVEQSQPSNSIQYSKYPYEVKNQQPQYPFSSMSEYQSPLPELSYSRKLTSNFKQNTDSMNIPISPRTHKKQEQIEFSLTLNNSQLKIDTDRFFEPIYEQQQYTKSSSKPTKTVSFSKKQVDNYLVQQQQPDEYERMIPKKVTFSNQIMSKAIDTPSSGRKIPTQPFKKTSVQPHKQADKIRRLMEQTKNNLSKLVTQKFQIPSTVSLKKQIR